MQVWRGRGGSPARQQKFFIFGHFLLGPGQGPFTAYGTGGSKRREKQLFAQSRALGQTRAADADFDENFAISRAGREPEPKTCQILADLLKIYRKVRARGLDPTIVGRTKAFGALKPHQALSFGLALPRKQPRRKRCATRIFEILAASWSAKIAKTAKSKEIIMILALLTPARSRRTQARFARLNNETKSCEERSQAAGLEGARWFARPPAEIFHFSATFCWVLVRALSQPMGQVGQKGAKNNFSPKAAC